jgi:tetratricopeptide (TPR) repeat protein
MDWMLRILEFSESQFKVLKKISDLEWISIELVKQRRILDGLKFAREILNEKRFTVLRKIAAELIRQDNLEVAKILIEEAFEIEKSIDKSKFYLKGEISLEISLEFANKGMFDDALIIASTLDSSEKWKFFKKVSVQMAINERLNDAYQIVEEILDNNDKVLAVKEIITELINLSKIESSLYFFRKIPVHFFYENEDYKVSVLILISNQLSVIGQLENAISLLKESLEVSHQILNLKKRIEVLKNISTQFAELSFFEDSKASIKEAFECFRMLKSDNAYFTISELMEFSSQFFKLGLFESSEILLEEAFTTSRSIRALHKREKFSKIAVQLVRQEKYEKGIEVAMEISRMSDRNSTIEEISIELARQQRIELALETLRKFLKEADLVQALEKISLEIVKNGNIENALFVNEQISDLKVRHSTLTKISLELVRLQRDEKALEIIQKISSESDQLSAFVEIIMELVFLERNNVALEFSYKYLSETTRWKTLVKISIKHLYQTNFDEALKILREIPFEYFTESDKLECSKYLLKGRINKKALEFGRMINSSEAKLEVILNTLANIFDDESQEFLNILFFECVQSIQYHISNSIYGSYYYRRIVDEISGKVATNVGNTFVELNEKVMTKLDNQDIIEVSIPKVYSVDFDSLDIDESISALAKIYFDLSEQGKFEEAKKYLNKILNFIAQISDEADKYKILKEIFLKFKLNFNEDDFILITKVCLDSIRNLIYDDESAYEICISFIEISKKLALMDKLEEAEKILEETVVEAYNIGRTLLRCQTLGRISAAFFKLGNFSRSFLLYDDALIMSGNMSDDNDCRDAFMEISQELSFVGDFEHSLEAANHICFEFEQSLALSNLTIQMASQGSLDFAIVASKQIKNLQVKNECWDEIGSELVNKIGPEKAIKYLDKIQEYSDRFYFLNGWIDQIPVNRTSRDITLLAISNLNQNLILMGKLLIKYVINQIIYVEIPQEKFNKFIDTLKIEWVSDFKNNIIDLKKIN